MAGVKCGATWNGHTCTLKAGHGGSVCTEVTPLSPVATRSISWAVSMGTPRAS